MLRFSSKNVAGFTIGIPRNVCLKISEVMVTGNNVVGAAFRCERKVDVAGGGIYDDGNAQLSRSYDRNLLQLPQKLFDFFRARRWSLIILG